VRIRKLPHGTQLPLFDTGGETPPVSSYVSTNADRLRRWAERGILFGTSSWKYPGWQGMVYTRNYPSQRAFEQTCLAEYATVFPTVCADFALYDFPQPKTMGMMYDQTPGTFTVSLKVTDRITVKQYPNLPRHGDQAGKENPDFLSPSLFTEQFLGPVGELKEKCGAIIFEFSTFAPGSGITLPLFLRSLDAFFARIPKHYSYSVEIRNREFLVPDYFALLKSHGVAHVLNNWTRMPAIDEQIRSADALPAPFAVIRALLKPGRTYQQAVEFFQPYDAIKEVNPGIRAGVATTAMRCVQEEKKLYAYINNRAEGNSPKTIEAILDVLDSYPEEKL
jgi:uncharacterized protein YecE (DUF72 family)